MRIALTHNLQVSDSEEEAEFDSRETIAALASAMERLGHRVDPIEVGGPATVTVARLEAYAPDLIFNTAEGRRGRFREAFFPALFEELGLPYTGSDPYVLAITLDKRLTKVMAAEYGVATPQWQFVEALGELDSSRFRYPVIVKPNFEGSSKGITQDSVVEEAGRLGPKVAAMLERYPAGILVEEFIAGKDVTVPYLEKLAEHGNTGILSPSEYVIDEAIAGPRRHAIYDFPLKSVAATAVSVRAPAELPGPVEQTIRESAGRLVRRLGCRDVARLDFRVSPEGAVYFLEVNALPSLEPGASIYAAAALEGLHLDGVLGAVLASAVRRFAIRDTPRSKGRPLARGPLKVGFTYNVKRQKPTADGLEDAEAEYDSPETLQAIREAIASHGHEVVDLEANAELPTYLIGSQVDVVFNIAEGIRGRSRESQVPALLDLLDIPYTGSDPAALAISLDKTLAKRMVRSHDVLTPDYVVMTTGRERIPKGLSWPLLVKPIAEGSSKGVVSSSVCHDERQLRELAREMIAKYRQAVLVEEYIRGREFTVGLLGDRRPRVLPPMEVVFLDESDPTPVYSFETKLQIGDQIGYDAPAKVDDKTRRKLEECARRAFSALGCRDVARVDLRLDPQGLVYFIECNPLPGLTPGWSDLVMIAESAGMSYRTLIGEILAGAIRRYRQRLRERRNEGGGAAASTESARAGEHAP